MLLSNYSDLAYIFNLEVDDFLRLVNRMLEAEDEKALEKQDDKLYFRWVIEMMMAEEPLSFQEYKDRAYEQTKPKEQRTKESEAKGVEAIKKFEAISQLYLEKEGE